MNDLNAVYGVDWQRFGLKKNPYDIRPLQEGGDISIEGLFIGREEERKKMDMSFASEEGGCLVVCGEAGVGKTSLVNIEKFIWKTSRPKLLFSSRREMEASLDNLTKQRFLLNCIASVLHEIRLTSPDLFKHETILQRLSSIVDVVNQVDQSFGIDVVGTGASYGRSRLISQPLQLADSTLESGLSDLVKLVREREICGKKHKGVIIHMNNFDTLTKDKEGVKKVITFFNEIRDVLQTPNVFFVFIGPSDFFDNVISVEKRVAGIFPRTPILLRPLSKTQLIEVTNKRLEAFKDSSVAQIIPPVADAVISRLYDYYEGDVRSIFSSLKDLLLGFQGSFVKTMDVDEAIILLGKLRLGELKELTPREMKVVQRFVDSNEKLNQSQIALDLKQAASNITPVIRKLLSMGVVEVVDTQGLKKFLDLTMNFKCLRDLRMAQERAHESARLAEVQMSLNI